MFYYYTLAALCVSWLNIPNITRICYQRGGHLSYFKRLIDISPKDIPTQHYDSVFETSINYCVHWIKYIWKYSLGLQKCGCISLDKRVTIEKTNTFFLNILIYIKYWLNTHDTKGSAVQIGIILFGVRYIRSGNGLSLWEEDNMLIIYTYTSCVYGETSMLINVRYIAIDCFIIHLEKSKYTFRSVNFWQIFSETQEQTCIIPCNLQWQSCRHQDKICATTSRVLMQKSLTCNTMFMVRK